MFDFLDFEQAKQSLADGRTLLTSVDKIPSPWTEAVKGLFHVQNIEFSVVRLEPMNPEFHEWAGSPSAPALRVPGRDPITHWNDILLYVDGLPGPQRLLPSDANLRAQCVGFIHELCAPMGLGWCRRLLGIHAGMNGEGGYPKPIAAYLAKKYGYDSNQVDKAPARVVALLEMYAAQLKAQKDKGHRFYFGDQLSAVDIYSAAFMAIFSPLPESACPMNPVIRSGFESLDATTRAALDPLLLKHRDYIYDEFLELPVRL